MPLSRLGKKIKKAFEKEYGNKEGDRYFYGFEHKHPRLQLTRKK